MAYATTDEAIALYGPTYVQTCVTREDTADIGSLEAALDDATDLIDSYIGGEVTVPLTAPVPSIVRKYCIDIACYSASGDAGTVTEEKRKRYEDAISWLKSVSRGDAQVPGLTETPNSESVPEIVTEERIFSRTKMSGLL